MFGAVIARGEDYRQVFQYFRPDFGLETERQARLDVGLGEYLNGYDLYPDVRPCLHALHDAGYFVGIAGNQTTRAGRFLRELNLPCDVLATSDDWGVTKPDTAFFTKLIIKRGPWGHITYQHGTANIEINSLTELPHALTTFQADTSRWPSVAEGEQPARRYNPTSSAVARIRSKGTQRPRLLWRP